jgi:hypothetical protein
VREAAPLLALFLAALVLAQPQLAVSTDSPVYEPGTTATIKVEGPPGAPVGLEVRGPAGELVALKQLALDAKGVAYLQLELDPACSEGVYTVYAATPGAFAQAAFSVLRRPAPAILLAPPGQAEVGKEIAIPGFVYPGLPLEVTVYVKPPGGDWELAGVAKANESGWFTVAYKPVGEGVHLLKAVYNGSEEYAPASSTANFTAARAPPPQWSVSAPQRAWLGETASFECAGCDYVLARTVAGERQLKPGAQVELDAPGPWILYPAKGKALGSPAVLLVRARVSASVEGPAEAGVGEPVQLKAQLSLPVQALKVRFESGGKVLGDAVSRSNGTALLKVAFAEVGEYEVAASVQPTSVFEAVPGGKLALKVVGERVYVRLIAVDSKGRRLYNAVVELDGARLEAPMGVAETVVRRGVYDVKVLWRGLTVYAGRVGLEGGNVTLTAQLYDLEVKVLDFLGRPAPGESVELYNATELLALALTDSEGKALFIRLPPGTYTVKAGEAQAQVAVPLESGTTLRLPPPSWLVPAVVLLAALALAAVALKKGGLQVKISKKE